MKGILKLLTDREVTTSLGDYIKQQNYPRQTANMKQSPKGRWEI